MKEEDAQMRSQVFAVYDFFNDTVGSFTSICLKLDVNEEYQI